MCKDRSFRFLIATTLLLGSFVWSSPARTQTQANDGGDRRPNVLLIMTDDQGYGDFGVKGNPAFETPRLDAFAKNSASMNHFYVSPVCSPTRASLMTGRYNYRTGVTDTYKGRSMMRSGEVTVAEALNRAGYRTGIFGKWHLGDNHPLRPSDQGFDTTLVHRGGGLAQPSEPLGNKERYTNPILFRNGRKVFTEGFAMDVYTDETMRFIRQAHENGQPWFAYLATHTPHAPFHDVPEKRYQHYLDKKQQLAKLLTNNPQGKQREKAIDKLARIGAMITNIDRNVGRVLEQLDRLGVAKNTLVLFLVDNGPNSRRYVGPFRGKKSEVYEGGVRSPLWLRWPAELKAEMASDRPAAHIDLMPTILDAAGVPVPEQAELDGRSVLPLLRRESAEWPERSIVIQTHRGTEPDRYRNFMIRRGPWKLLQPRSPEPKQGSDEPPFQLYNVVEDPDESENLVEKRPEIAARLKTAYDEWLKDIRVTGAHPFAPPRIVVGAWHENPSVLTWQDRRGNDGWGKGSNGKWLLRIGQPGDYDVRLLFKHPPESTRKVTLQIGEQKRTRQVGAGADWLLFRGVDLQTGPVELKATVETGDGSRGPYHVVIERRPGGKRSESSEGRDR